MSGFNFMKKVVFYSWQSDLLNGTNRTLIEDALKNAAKEIMNEEADIEAVIDRDTQGVAGAPNIATAIFEKISSADIFVADVSIIGKAKKRSVPNPNVLIELGYALKALGHERIILIFNTAFGKVENLPFDLRMHRTLTYDCSESVSDRSQIKKNLTDNLKSALLTGFSSIAPQQATSSIVEVLKENPPRKIIELRDYLDQMLLELEKVEPKTKQEGGTVDDLLSAIPKTENLATDFAKVAETVVLMKDTDSAKEVFKWFGRLLTKYDPIIDEQGRVWNCNGDFYKFIGHEFFVIFITPFLKEERWDELKELLKGTFMVGPTQHNRNERKESWVELSEHSPLLIDEGTKRKRLSFHGDILKDRHGQGLLAEVVPFNIFAEADFFLHLWGPGTTTGEYRSGWYPRSDIWLRHNPRFVVEAIDYPTAMRICGALQITDVDELKRRLSNLQIRYEWHPPASKTDIDKIGSEGGAVIIQADE